MIISLSPQRRNDTLTVTKSGDVLTINGEDFDFTDLPDGETIPAGVVPCEFITGPVMRIDGDLHLTVILPHSANPPSSVTHPDPIIDPDDGPIPLPTDEA
jgi:hypothetical protein